MLQSGKSYQIREINPPYDLESFLLIHNCPFVIEILNQQRNQQLQQTVPKITDESQTVIVKFCSTCGEPKAINEANFCPNCGSHY